MEQNKIIITLVRQNDESGFTLLYDRYAGALYGLILQMVNDIPLAEELLATTLMKVFCEIKRYDPEKSSFFIWMMNISRRLAKDHILSNPYPNR